MAEQVLEKGETLYCLGQIVHNDEEIRRLEAKGLCIIDQKDLCKLHNETVLIRAHGEPPETYQIAHTNNLKLLDASCPVVLKLQQEVRRSYDGGQQIYIYGKPKHPEVEALLGQVGKDAVVFQDVAELDAHSLPKKLTLYSQTTKSIESFHAVVAWLKQAGVSVEVRDTICRQVSNRAREVEKFAATHDVVVFVAGTRSSNGRSLYEVCKQVNPRSHFVSRVSEVHTSWFTSGDSVGICGATSTPQWLMENVREHILAQTISSTEPSIA